MRKNTGSDSDRNQRVYVRGIRGAITVSEDTEDEVLEATRQMLYVMIQTNGIKPEDVASAYFTTTMDLTSTYPALAARQLGWYDVALLCGHEMQVPSGLKRCIRVLIHWNTTLKADEVTHVYLRDAKGLRPDRQSLPEVSKKELEAVVKKFEMHSSKNNALSIPHDEEK